MKQSCFPIVVFPAIAQIVHAQSKSNPLSSIATLKDSSAECDKTLGSLTDSNATEMVKLPRGEATKLGALAGMVTRDTEEYAASSVYMRFREIVPPSSEHAVRG